MQKYGSGAKALCCHIIALGQCIFASKNNDVYA